MILKTMLGVGVASFTIKNFAGEYNHNNVEYSDYSYSTSHSPRLCTSLPIYQSGVFT